MNKAKTNDPFTIPDFLKVANRGKIKAKKSKAVFITEGEATPEMASRVYGFKDIDPEIIEMIKPEIKAGRFREHWLEDASTIKMFQRRLMEERAATEAKETAKIINKEAAKAEKALMKSLAPEFGLNVKIIVLVPNPKRQAGAARIPRFASLLEYLAKNPNASVAEIFRNTTYIKADFMRDQRLKIIKTDIITKSPVEKPKTIVVEKTAKKTKKK